MSELATRESSETGNVRGGMRTHIRSDGRCILEDTTTGKHFRLGPAEYRFYRLLASGMMVSEAHRRSSEASETWNEESSKQFLNWLIANRLYQLDCSNSTSPTDAKTSKPTKFNPLFARCSLGSPEKHIDLCTRLLRPIIRRELFGLGIVGVIFALSILMVSWREFLMSYSNLLAPGRTAQLALILVMLKLLHEFAHGIACQYWGGRVRDCGIALICGVPLPYVDLTDSCRFPLRRQRVLTALAGVLTEIVVATLAVFAWKLCESPVIDRIATDIVLAAVSATLLFNLNPLMKFDGYYVLSECLDEENLYQRGNRYAQAQLKRLFFGGATSGLESASSVVKMYGISSFLWRLLAITTIFFTVVKLLHGIGIALVAWTIYLWWVHPMLAKRKIQSASLPESTTLQAPLRLLMRPAMVALAGLAALWFLPLPVEVQGHAVVQYDPPSVIRSPVDGFIESIHVSNGASVSEGQLLATLANDEFVLRSTDIELQIAKAEQAYRGAQLRRDAKAVQQHAAELVGLREQAAEVSEKLASMEVRATTAGVFSTRADASESLVGTYLEQGGEIGIVGSENRKRLRLLVQQEAADSLRTGLGLRYLGPGGVVGNSHVTCIQPRVSTASKESTLGADCGGPLPVAIDAEGTSQFCNPQNEILASLSSAQSQALRVGHRMSVTFGKRQRLGEWVWNLLKG